MSDIIENNAIWCFTFQLVWNDMKKDVVKKRYSIYAKRNNGG
ncbi:MAG: hypothetical protein PHH22_02375 [Clostridia bacterium]|nr:hypothetical protein [Clostridia bacterium]